MTQPRKAERIRSLLSAQIAFSNGASTFGCIVRNISPMGALLQIPDRMALPRQFELSVPARARHYQARVVWRGDDLVGAEFLDGTPPDRPSARDESDAARIDRLMAENANLKKLVLQLRARVDELSS